LREITINADSIAEIIEHNGWLNVPKIITSREGNPIDTSSDVWALPDSTRRYSSVNFGKIIEPGIRWATKRYIQNKLERTSATSGFTAFGEVWRILLRNQSEFEVIEGVPFKKLKQRCIKLVEKALSDARKEHRLWDMYLPIQWYVWCAENYPELGFCTAYALELDSITVPGTPKGEAVRMEDLDRGPLHRTLELPLLIKAMRMDKGTELFHLQEKAALALSIALGRNPANLTFLKETDLVNLTPDVGDPTWIIRMPRIKKRQLNPRSDMLDEYLDPEFAGYVLELIEANKEFATYVEVNDKTYEIARPLFVKSNGNKSAMRSGLVESYFNMTSEGITRLIQEFVRRHEIISPLTGEMLRITTRRLRYTLGTALAAEGVSRKELARILDHSDTQHVQVYFELVGSIVEHLDKAAAKGFAKYLNLFKGKIIEDDSEAINGDRDDKHLFFIDESNPTESVDIGVCGKDAICHLDPPFSCYLCEKFQPYRHADHEYVLECLLQDRDERILKYENARLGIQLDDVIMAVAQVAERCRLESSNVG
jgi:hypothetical protein